MEDSGRRRRLLLMVLGLVLAVVAGAAAFMLAQQPRPTTPEEETETVVVAAQNIPARTEITADHVETREIAASAKLAQAFTAVETVIGQTTVVPVFADQQITPNLLLGTQGDPLPIIPPDEGDLAPDSPHWRAFSITVPRDRAVGGLLQDGDHVDVIVSMGWEEIEETTLVQDEEGNLVPIGAQDPEIGAAVGLVTPDGVRFISGGVASKVVYTDLELLRADTEQGTYVVRVTLEQAEELTQWMRDTGDARPGAADTFTLALRSRADDRDVDLAAFGQTLDRLIELYDIPIPFFVRLSEMLDFPIEFTQVPILFPDLFEPPDEQEPTPAPQPQPEPSPEPEP